MFVTCLYICGSECLWIIAVFQARGSFSAMAYISRSSVDPTIHVPSIQSLEACAELVQQALFSIPSNVWTSYSRRNVRSDQLTHADQILLGLYSGVQSRGRLQFTRNTFKFPNLTRLILRYIQLLPHLQDFECTSIQINRNLRTIPHRDSNNRGYSIGWAVGNWTGGDLFLYDPYGTEQLVVTDAACKVASMGDILPGRRLDVHQPVCFDGNTIHATMPFQGDRVMIVFFCVKRNIPVSPSSSFLPFARFLGFRVPVFPSLLPSSFPAVPPLPLPSLALPSVPVSLSLCPVSFPLSPAPSLLSSSSSFSLSARSVVSCGSGVSFSSSVLRSCAAPSLPSPCSLPPPFSLSRLLLHFLTCFLSPNVRILLLIMIPEWPTSKRETVAPAFAARD